MKSFDLSSSQKRTLITQIKKPESKTYWLTFKADYSIEDLNYIKKSLNILISGNLNLRIGKRDNSTFYQYHTQEAKKYEIIDLSKINMSLNDFIIDYYDNFTFSIFDEALYRIFILKDANKCHVVFFMHHILIDGTSATIFAKNLSNCVDSLKNNKKFEFNNQDYSSYVEKEKEYLKSNDAKKDKEFWINNLKDYNSSFYEFEDSSVGYFEKTLEDDLIEKSKDFSKICNTNISPFILALSAVSLYFFKSTDYTQMVWNSSYHGRNFGEEFNDAIGMFVNMLPLKLDFDENKTFKEYLIYTKEILKKGLSHGKLSFDKYSADLQKNDLNPAKLSMFSIVSNSIGDIKNFQMLDIRQETEFPFHIRINKSCDDANGLQNLLFEYNKNYMSSNEIKKIADGIIGLLNQLTEDSSKKLNSYVVSDNEFFKGEKFFKDLINDFDDVSIIPNDINNQNNDFELENTFKSINKTEISRFSKNKNISNEELFLSSTLFNMSKFVFSKDILISSIFNRNIKNNTFLNDFNELPFGLKINTDNSVEEYLNLIKDKLNSINYANYPLTNEKTNDFDSKFLFNFFSLENNEINHMISNSDFSISIKEDLDEYVIIASYNKKLYSKDIVNTFLDSLILLTKDFISNPKKTLKNISISKNNNHLNDFKIELKDEAIISKLLENKVLNNKDKIILYSNDDGLTFNELNEKSNKIANGLIKKGVKIEDKIPFIMKRDSNLICTVFGIIKSGACAIPIDPKYPEERINQILEDSNAKYIINNLNNDDFSFKNSIEFNELIKEENTKNPDISLKPDNLCFMIYTSGSTGRPKGVMLTHSGITNYINNNALNCPIDGLIKNVTKFISISTVSFIVFFREIFATILNEVPVIFADEEQSINPYEFVKLAKKYDADGFGSTPTRLLEYLEIKEFQDVLDNFKYLIVGGEGFPSNLYTLLRKYTDALIYNSYGPTEVTIASHGKLLKNDTISAGWPMLNVVDNIMDIDGNPLPSNVIGELYVGGAGIAKGYLNNDKLTKKSFLKIDDIPFYNTGDFAKRDNKGELFVLGRSDNQVKIRGLRIELEDIENTISSYDGVNASVVIAKDIHGEKQLCGYFTEFNASVSIDDLRDYLFKKLPKYMVPPYLIKLDKFPKTPNGKTDFKNLPEPSLDDAFNEKLIKPETEYEKGIFDLVSEILETDSFGINSDLFSLGLSSLSIIRLISKISDKYDINIPLANLMDSNTIKEIAKELEKYAKDDNDFITDSNKDFYPLTQNQLGVYFDCIKKPNELNYNLPKLIRFNKDIDSKKLKDSIVETINKHPYLKTRLLSKDADIYQEEIKNIDFNKLIEIEKIDKSISQDEINNFIKPFSLFDGPLIRFKIYDTPEAPVLLADFHHIILDGTSLNILFNDIGKVYDGLNVISEKFNGFDYSLYEENIELIDIYKDSEKYFEKQIADFDNASIISPDLDGLEEDGVVQEKHKFLSKEKIDNLSKDLNISQNNIFLSATAISLSKFIYNKDLLISTVSSGRSNPKFSNTLAMMVKTLPLVLKIDSSKTILEFFKYVNENWLNVFKYDVYPFTKISAKYDIFPDFFYAYHGKIIEEVKINGEKFQRESLDSDSLKFKLSINVVEINNQYKVSLQYNDALYSDKLTNLFLDSIDVVLNKFLSFNKDEFENKFIKDLSIVEDDFKGDQDFKNSIQEIEEHLLNKQFENQVNLHKNDLALIATDGEFTYDMLNKKANIIANNLIENGVKKDDTVMFILKRDSRLISTILGILKTGAAFISIDPEYPEDRIEHVFNDSSAKFVITHKGNDLKGALDIDELLQENKTSNPNPNLSKDDVAYIIYTSGSTGLPKGVMLSHGNLINYCYPAPQNNYIYDLIQKGNRAVSITTVAFDIFIHEVFSTLLNGLTLVFANEEESKNPLALVDLMKNTNVDVISGTPSRILQYLEIDEFREVMKNCAMVFIGGEQFSPTLYNSIEGCLGKNLKDYKESGIYNVYGPTEITISSNMKPLESPKNISVGKTLFNVYEKVMDEDANPLPNGIVGELYIAGEGVSKGYINREKLNKERYVTINDILYYKSGDFGKFEDNGEVVILGRLDNQIKLRGLRIEIGEIENAISKYDGINKIVVVVKKVKGNDHLCAYFTVDDNIKSYDKDYSINIDDLKSKISKTLVPYMVPTIYTELEKFPQTLNGKIDIKNLPEVEIQWDYIAPENDTEALFASIFEDILNIEEVGVTDNFFELGGTSLLVTKIVLESSKNDFELKYADVFQNPTPRLLANHILNSNQDKNLTPEADYDYSKINDILKENTMNNFLKGSKTEIGNVLLTGATGFFGIHVLKEFLESEKGNIYCMLRKTELTSSEDRLKILLFYYFSNNYEELFGSRIHIIEGDITNPDDFTKALSFDIDTVINCAANVKHFSSGTDIEDINIGGVKNCLDFVKAKDCKFIQISTTSVAGESINNFPPEDLDFNEKTLYEGQVLDNKYLSSKFLAEREILEKVVDDGIDAKIMRVGNLMARSSDSEFQINFKSNGFVNRLKAFNTIGKMSYNLLSSPTELTPIDVVAKAVLALSSTPKNSIIFHVYNSHVVFFSDILDIMTSQGFKIEAVENAEYEKAFQEAKDDKTKEKGISGLLTAVGMGKSKNRGLVKVSNDFTVQVLYRLGVHWPLVDKEYLNMFIKHLDELNFFEY
ncbi:amino acid adenylation domain-containing protein [Methanobrevibacter sp. DSM 116169]|uniref:amino acid adenylation domain-containing protein n=1 Tax=Methanobrevibacter sp. DSM 116169 TaxID=3242727 RepID=UPI0038FCEC78